MTSGDSPVPSNSRPSADAVARWLQERLAVVLELTPGTIDGRERFNHYGLDSMRALSVVADLGRWLDRRLPATLLWDYPTIDRLARYLADDATQAESLQIPMPSANAADEPIAIVGIGCRFPGAADPDAFWRLLRTGGDAISEVPADRWDVEAYFDADRGAAGKMNTRWGGFLDRIDGFDAEFFGISPREAMEMDPQQRLMLELSWEALDDAGQRPDDLKESRTGVFFSAAWNDYATLRQNGGTGRIGAHTTTGSHHSIIANRVSYLLGLQGPSMTVDTGCSGSLVAIHLACQSLRSGESAMALAGGVNLMSAPDSTIAVSKFGALAPDGRSKAFDAAANGYVRGEGGGIVVLKRLSAAIANGDRVTAVIRGSAVNNDGFSNGLTAPNHAAQEKLLHEAYQRAGIAPDQVQYVEAHGTGTALGDPIEAKAMGAVLGAHRPVSGFCSIGSVKTNIGHLEAASGIAGVIKVVLAMKYGELPASLHFHQPNPEIPFDELGLRVQAERSAWPSGERLRVAGVSAFGFGGTNSHVVLTDLRKETACVLPLGASSPAALEGLARHVADRLGTATVPFDTVVRSVAGSASQGEHRVAIAASTATDAKLAIVRYLAGRREPTVQLGSGTRAPEVVFVASGQGSQWRGMGRETLQREPAFRAEVEACDEVLRPLLGWSVLDELAGATNSTRLDRVDAIQPLLFVVQVAQAALWRSWGVEPSIVLGQSIADVSAGYIAGILDLKDAARVICSRSRLIRERFSGHGLAMLVRLPADELRSVAGAAMEGVSIAGLNGPRTTLVSGAPAAIEALRVLFERQRVVCQLVEGADYPSHTPAMEGLRAPLVEELSGIRRRRSRIPMMCAVTSSIMDDTQGDAEYWALGERTPVRFWPSIEELVRRGHDTFVELGGRGVHANHLRKALADLGPTVRMIQSFRREDESRTLAEGLALLHARGVPVRWPSASPAPASQLFTISAGNEAALRAYAEASLALADRTTDSVADICYTSNARRSHHDVRMAVLCRTIDDLRSGLRAWLEGRHDEALRRRPKLAFVFQGQGGQWWGMGQELLRTEPIFSQAIDECEQAFRRWVDWSLRAELERSDHASRIGEVDVAQPAIFAIQVALAALWRSWGIVPDAVVGHSMGEVAAAHVAGAISLDEASRIICHRSRMLRRVSGTGAMAVVGLSRQDAEHAVAVESAAVAVAGSNSLESTVLSGDPDGLNDVLARLDEAGVFHRLLQVDVASHSPQMDPLYDELVDQLEGLSPRDAGIATFSSVTAQQCSGTAFDAMYWGRNLRDPFLFADTIARMADAGYTLFVEVGPHPILSGAIGAMQQTAGTELVALPSMKRGEPERETMLASLGALYERAFSPAWRALHHHGGRLVSFPGYPWQRKRFWPTPEELAPVPSAVIHERPASSDPRRSAPGTPAESAEPARTEDIIARLADPEASDRAGLLEEYLVALIAGVLGYGVGNLPVDHRLSTLGLESILAADIRNRIQQGLGVQVSMVSLLRGTTRDVVARVLEAMDGDHSGRS